MLPRSDNISVPVKTLFSGMEMLAAKRESGPLSTNKWTELACMDTEFTAQF